MSKSDRAKKRIQRKGYARPSMPKAYGANDNVAFANDNQPPAQIKGVLLTPRQAARFYDADQKCQSDDPAMRKRGQFIFAELESEIAAKVDAELTQQGINEQDRLEALRGMGLEVGKDKVRAKRDGLATLLSGHTITGTQHDAGVRYRADYELIDPERDLTPPALDQSRHSGRGGDGFALIRRQREEFVRDLEASIQRQDPSFRGALGTTEIQKVGRAVWVLRAVAGKGEILSLICSGGAVRQRALNSLIIGLNSAAIAYGLE